MSIQVTCPQCGTINKVNQSLAGRRVRCPKCDTAVHVPEQDITMPPPLPIDAESSDVDANGGGVDGDDAPITGAILTGTGDAEAVPNETTPTASVPAGVLPNDDVDLLDEDDDDDSIFTRSKRDEEELDMTPMVDVTFLLLIFFMVTAAFSLQKSIEMPRQQTDAPSTTVVEEEEEELDMVEVQVDEFGSFLVLAADWQEETPGKQNLITALKRARESGVEARLVIKVHELCKLQYLVDAMDAGTIAGYAQTQVTQVEEFD